MKTQQQHEYLRDVDRNAIQPIHSQPLGNIPKTRHMYVEQQNIYGRFIPYLLLKDQLHSQIDSSGNTALNHMCSHNSPYIPLYLSTIKDNDPILNRSNRMGHTPLDVAGLYCDREYVELLKSKGAKDTGQVDYWAIQGANLDNWSGKIDPTRKQLIHWAAYNDLPQVLQAFVKEGISVTDFDNNNNTPMDLATLNKSYQSVKYLASLGLRPRKSLLQSTDSYSIKKLFQKIDESNRKKNLKKIMKMLITPIFFLLTYYLANMNEILPLLLITFFVWFYLIFSKTTPDQPGARSTSFKSQLLNKDINHRDNHHFYLFFNFLQSINGLVALYYSQIQSYLSGVIFWIFLVITMCFIINLLIQIYGIVTNLTHPQLLQAHKFPHLFPDIHYIQQRNMLIRKYRNPYNNTWFNNIRQYFNRT